MESVPPSICPKNMTYGPCGGVHADGRCEVASLPCPFAKGNLAAWQQSHVKTQAITPAGQAFLETMVRRPVIVTDLPTTPLSADSIRASADVLAGHADAVLLGDHSEARVQFPPAYRAMLVHQAGLPTWPGLNCRDRNRVALEGELAALAHANVAGFHCITGDHTASGHRPDAKPVFDLDSTQLAALANSIGFLTRMAGSRESNSLSLMVKGTCGSRKFCKTTRTILWHCTGSANTSTNFASRRRATTLCSLR